MGLFDSYLKPHAILSGGMTATNDALMGALGIKKGGTLFALNDAAKHGPLETSIEKGRPANYSELKKDRNQRLATDESGMARPIADIAAIIGLIYGGGALAGAGGGSSGAGAASGGATGASGAATGAASGGSYSAGAYGTAAGYGGAAAPYATSSAASSSPGLLSTLGEYLGTGMKGLSTAKTAQGLLTPPQVQPVQSAPQSTQGPQMLASMVQQEQQKIDQQRQEEELMRRGISKDLIAKFLGNSYG